MVWLFLVILTVLFLSVRIQHRLCLVLQGAISECTDIIPCRRSLLSYPGQLAIMKQRPKHVDALPMRERLDGSGLADFSPAVLDWRIWAEA